MKDKYVLDFCETAQRKSEAFKLRYKAYKNAGAIPENPAGAFKDKYDLQPNAKTCIIYENSAPVASVRACVYSKEHQFLQIPGLEVYGQEIEKEIGLDKMIIESNRFVIHPDKVDSKYLFKVPFRFIILNVLKFSSDYIITAVRPRHVSLYRRFLGLEPISAPKQYPGINVEMIMMAGECSALLPIAMDKEEVFRFTEEEIDSYQFSTSTELFAASY